MGVGLGAEHVEGLFDHARGVDALGARVDELAGHNADDFIVDALELGGAFFLADLELAALEDLEDDVGEFGVFAEGVGQVGGWGGLALGDVEEDVGDLEDVVEVGFDAGAVF